MWGGLRLRWTTTTAVWWRRRRQADRTAPAATKTTRYEAHDRPAFEAEVKRLCPDCECIYQRAQDATSSRLSRGGDHTGADVLVLDAVDAKSATATVDRAKESDIPVLAYGRA